MDDKTNITFIDPHPKCIGCYQQRQLILGELLLEHFPLVTRKSAVIKADGITALQRLVDFLYLISCGTIDNARPIQSCHVRPQCRHFICRLFYDQTYIAAIHRVAENSSFAWQQIAANICFYFFRCCGRQSQCGRTM